MKFIKKLLIVILLILIIGYILGINTINTKYFIKTDLINNQIKITQISDFHSIEKYEKILYITKTDAPHLIVLTGDIFTKDSKLDSTVKFVEELTEIAPVFYVNGEKRSENYSEFKEEIIELGVTVLEDEKKDVIIEGQMIRLIGINDTSYTTLFSENLDEADNIKKTLENNIDKTKFNIVLSHRPQYFKTYVDSGANLVLTGHTHGGTVKVPVINKGLHAPDQGFNPKYDYGIYEEENTTMIVSSGVAPIYHIPRFYNSKEVVSITIN